MHGEHELAISDSDVFFYQNTQYNLFLATFLEKGDKRHAEILYIDLL